MIQSPNMDIYHTLNLYLLGGWVEMENWWQMDTRMAAVKFITICDVVNCQQKPSTYTYIFICLADEEINLIHLWKVLAFKFYNS